MGSAHNSRDSNLKVISEKFMEVVILAGGLGTRLSEETSLRPKPMVEIGGVPILFHIMNIYASHGFNNFIVCLGYKGYQIKRFFHDLHYQTSDIQIDLAKNRCEILSQNNLDWKVKLIDTGAHTMTGGRLKRIEEFLTGDTFCMTYGDGLGNVDVTALVDFHSKSGKAATLTATSLPGRFGVLDLNEDGSVASFTEKPRDKSSGLINAGFFVLQRSVLDLISGDDEVWEQEPLRNLAATNQLNCWRHDGFWHPMDTKRDKDKLVELFETQNPPPWMIS